MPAGGSAAAQAKFAYMATMLPRWSARSSLMAAGNILGMPVIKKIISGGQTGADRAALDFAIEHGIPHGGWCPKGRLAEDGCIDARYQLTETSTKNYPQRTEKNVQDADGTVIFTVSPKLTGGSKKTASLATAYGKPWIHVHGGQHDVPLRLRAFIRNNQITTLNVAGSRASERAASLCVHEGDTRGHAGSRAIDVRGEGRPHDS